VEVGCRGFAAKSLYGAYTALGITAERRRRGISNTTEVLQGGSGSKEWIRG